MQYKNWEYSLFWRGSVLRQSREFHWKNILPLKPTNDTVILGDSDIKVILGESLKVILSRTLSKVNVTLYHWKSSLTFLLGMSSYHIKVIVSCVYKSVFENPKQFQPRPKKIIHMRNWISDAWLNLSQSNLFNILCVLGVN